MKKIIVSILIGSRLLLSAAGCSNNTATAVSEINGGAAGGENVSADQSGPAEGEDAAADEGSDAVSEGEAGLSAVYSPAPFETDSVSYCVLSQDGEIVLGRNSYQHLRPASMTKVLTAIVVLEKMSLKDTVVVSQDAVMNIDVMSSGTDPLFKPGEKLTVEDLLYALLLASSNAAGNILAEAAAGSNEAFASLMNAKCLALGLKDSNFENPHGLDADNHYSCAHDMAVILKEALNNKTIAEIMAAKDHTIPATEYADARTFQNGCGFINGTASCEGVYAGKPGWSCGAQGTLVTACKRNNETFYACVMDSDEKLVYTDTANLLNYAYDPASAPEPEIYNVFTSEESASMLHLNWSTVGSISACRIVYWNTSAGNAAAVSADLTPGEWMDYSIPLSETGSYTVQLFITGEDGTETGTGMSFLFTGSVKRGGKVMTWNSADYYENTRGVLQTGVIEFEYSSVYADELGRIIHDAFTPDGRYYAGSDGYLVTGWQDIEGSRYYFQADGTKATGEYLLDGTLYNFDENGVLQQ